MGLPIFHSRLLGLPVCGRAVTIRHRTHGQCQRQRPSARACTSSAKMCFTKLSDGFHTSHSSRSINSNSQTKTNYLLLSCLVTTLLTKKTLFFAAPLAASMLVSMLTAIARVAVERYVRGRIDSFVLYIAFDSGLLILSLTTTNLFCFHTGRCLLLQLAVLLQAFSSLPLPLWLHGSPL